MIATSIASPTVPGTTVPVQSGLSSILRIQADAEWQIVRRRGRFAMDVDCARSPPHRQAAIDEAFTRMVKGLLVRPEGSYVYVERVPGGAFEGRQISKPLEHFEYSEDVSPDPGTVSSPDPRDDVAFKRWERAEHKRIAKGLMPDLVDFVITAHFKRKINPGFRVHVPHQHEVQAVLRANGAVQRLATSYASGRSGPVGPGQSPRGLVTARR
jgi:hypothetical protein